MPIETLLAAFVYPFAAFNVWCALVWRPWSKKKWGGDAGDGAKPTRDRLLIALTVVGAVTAFAFSHRAIDGKWPLFPPTLRTRLNDWFAYLALVAGVFSVVDVLFVRPPWLKFVVRAVGALLVTGLPVMLLIESGWYTGTLDFRVDVINGASVDVDRMSGLYWIAGTLVPVVLGWYAFSIRTPDESRLPTIVPLGVYLGVASPAMVMWSVAINSQFLGAVALMLVPIGIIAIWRPRARATDALLGYALLMAFASLVAAYHHADKYPDPWSAGLIVFAPTFLLLRRLPVVKKRGVLARTVVSTALVLVPSGIGAGIAASDYFASSQSAEDDYYDSLYGE